MITDASVRRHFRNNCWDQLGMSEERFEDTTKVRMYK